MARDLKFWIEEEGFYYLLVCSKNKGADQLQGYHAADLHLYFFLAYAKSRFSHDVAHLMFTCPF